MSNLLENVGQKERVMWNNEDLAAEIDALFGEVQLTPQRPSAELALELYVARCVESKHEAQAWHRWRRPRGAEARRLERERAKKRQAKLAKQREWWRTKGKARRAAASVPKRRPHFTSEERALILRLHLIGATGGAIARALKATRQSVNIYLKKVKNEGVSGRRK